MKLDIPLYVAGQPGIYKLPKEVFIGAKDLIKKVPVTWWNPRNEFTL